MSYMAIQKDIDNHNKNWIPINENDIIKYHLIGILATTYHKTIDKKK